MARLGSYKEFHVEELGQQGRVTLIQVTCRGAWRVLGGVGVEGC